MAAKKELVPVPQGVEKIDRLLRRDVKGLLQKPIPRPLSEYRADVRYGRGGVRSAAAAAAMPAWVGTQIDALINDVTADRYYIHFRDLGAPALQSPSSRSSLSSSNRFNMTRSISTHVSLGWILAKQLAAANGGSAPRHLRGRQQVQALC